MHDDPALTTWWQDDRRRLDRDADEIDAMFPELTWKPVAAGQWTGRLPRWPFSRSEPVLLSSLIGLGGLTVEVAYTQAYPMVPPRIYPLDPQPEIGEWTVHAWHVNGDGSLCLLRDEAMWDPAGSVTDLLLKAAGWRIEYALMKRRVVSMMSDNGIVSDPSLDGLVAIAVSAADAPSDEGR